MTFRQVCKVSNNQIIVNLPPDFLDKKQVTVIIDDVIDTKAHKLEQLKAALNDPLFIADIKEIQNDFDSIDHENI
ncbi:MAG: hypothetical protein IPK11_10215 [Ignavibacteria bacterium]|jgi:hypothetical protein|nr:hypothetical protein [Ignavibacteria bacterium]